MKNVKRRDFMKKTLVTGAAFSVVPGYLIGGFGCTQPSDKIRLGLIGTGSRMSQLAEVFFKQEDCSIVALCDVDKPKLTKFAEKFSFSGDTYGDYRRILERKDIDAVVVATPDHWHGPMAVEACEAGMDIYLEKPISNTVIAGVEAMEAAKRTKRIVQVGTQQRSWPEFQECAKAIQNGQIGNVSQVVVNHGMGGSGSRQQSMQSEPVPEGLDWEMWQGPAPRHPYSRARLSWRNWFDYGGGSITDWGVHHIDIVHMALGYDAKGPSLTAAAAMPNTSPDLVPDTFSISYQYDNFVMSFVSCVQPGFEGQGVFIGGPSFYGSQGYAIVNRSGYLMRSPASMSFGRQPATPTIETKNNLKPYDSKKESGAMKAHIRNWLDCVKSRQEPTCNAETGFYSSLPCLLGLQAIREGSALKWDPTMKTVNKA